MDFVKFYIVQLVKSAASRIKVGNKEKEQLLSKIVLRIENSKDLFPDLKLMERVVELEEAAKKLISIYRRLNKSHIDLERISYTFVNDRDSLQSILRRIITGTVKNKNFNSSNRQKLVFDDEKGIFYEISNETFFKEEGNEQEEEFEVPPLDLDSFLDVNNERIVEISSSTSNFKQEKEGKLETTGSSEKNSNEQIISSDDSLFIENGLAKKSLGKVKRTKETKDEISEELTLPLFKEINGSSNDKDKLNDENLRQEESANIVSEHESRGTESKLKEEYSEETEKIEEEGLDTQNEKLKEGELSSDESSISSNEVPEKSEPESREKSPEELYLELEKSLLKNIIDVDAFLNDALSGYINDAHLLSLISKAQYCMVLAEQLGHDMVAQLIRTYRFGIMALNDGKLPLQENVSELIKAVLIILISIIKNKDIDLDQYWERCSQLQEILRKLSYEV